MRSAIMREDTAVLLVVRPETLAVDEDALVSERERAERDGWTAGYAAGLAKAGAEVEAAAAQARSRQDSVLRALDTAVDQARDVLVTEHDRLQHAAAELAFQIAEAVLARELQLSSSAGLEAIHRALAESPESDGAVVRMNPADVEAIGDASQLREGVTIVPDPSVGAGGCVLEVGAAIVDARIEAALARVRKVLDEAMGKP
ncbi:MAG: FliH/SctL family protein [Acidimicrobiales bacterium]|jgi:flagellar biosynthesis/type III secretory pathway protein FliH